MAIKSSKDILLLLLAAKGHRGNEYEPIQGQTRLMKMVFLFEKEIYKHFKLGKAISEDAFPNFEAYDYGPYSAQVYTDLEFLVDIGLIDVTDAGTEDGDVVEAVEYEYWQATTKASDEQETDNLGRKFSLSQLGKDYVKEELKNQLTGEQWRILHEFKARCTGTSLRALLRYVYTKYEDMTKKSKIRDEILER